MGGFFPSFFFFSRTQLSSPECNLNITLVGGVYFRAAEWLGVKLLIEQVRRYDAHETKKDYVI